MAASGDGGELHGMYERKLRALTLAAAAKRVLDPKLDTTWERYITVYLSHRDAVATDLACLVSSYDQEAPLAAARALDAKQADGGALPPLLAAPFVIADNLETSVGVTSAGLSFLDEWEAGVDGPLVEAAQAAGGLLIGKAVLSELSFATTGVNPTFGTPRNPHVRSLIAGGGVASAVAARFATFGLGIDGRGAGLRVPAALCGVVAFRPTIGRLPTTGSIAVSPTRDSAGIVARSVGDAYLIDAALTGSATAPAHEALPDMKPLAGITLAKPTGGFWDDLDEGVAAETARAIATLESKGVTFVDVDVDPSAAKGPGGEPFGESASVATTAIATSRAIGAALDGREAVTAVSEYFWERGARTSVLDIAAAVLAEPTLSRLHAQLRSDRSGFASLAESLDATVRGREALRVSLAAAMADAGAVAMVWPAVSRLPCTLAEAEADEGGELDAAFGRNASVAANAGMCSVVLPCGAAGSGAARLPVALELAMPAGSDEELLAVARAVEAALPAPQAPRGL
ncbi:hypothetical protein FNF29_05438 [Cafeteria roenbergensis]|uniref:Amidase domain-containing protein n=1 Tax=Cafeteria roenbergensis TaxID=33653 RepID=A0A5A8CBI0_CAFRO|nr:hypothetical protein FNF29_05438 [Cafeteria roenbergensis]|eukprot:KAA0150198.1 hypothetical protein FNF29_05438 [Cafeteria roenbergensis]